MDYPASEYTKAGIQWVMHGNLDTARDLFDQATQRENNRCDAWLGLAHCEPSGKVSYEQIRYIHKSISTLGEDQIEAGAEIGYLKTKFDVGLADLTITVSTAIEVRSAWAISLILTDKIHDAYDYLTEFFPQDSNRNTELIHFIWALLWRAARSWVEVMNIATVLRTSKIPLYASVGEFFFGEATAYLGQSNVAHEVLFHLGKNMDASDTLAAEALITKALLHRTEHEEDKAVIFFDKAYQLVPHHRILDLKADKKATLLITTPELISERVDFLDPRTEPSLYQRESEKRESQRESLLDEAEKELERQIGMATVKERVHMLKAKIELGEKRKEAGLPAPATSRHLALTGPPGTGKTTIARILAKIYSGLGVMPTSNVLEVGRQDLVGEYLGSTAPKTQAILEKARGGILFIDEAYTLNQSGLSGGDAFGKEAIDTILTFIENKKDEIILILAGYEEEIKKLLDVNPGLRSRIPKSIKFTSYTPSELVQIAQALAEPRGSKLNSDAEQVILDAATIKTEAKTENGRSAIDIAGNGRWVRNIIEAAEDYRDFRVSQIADPDPSDMMIINGGDVKRALEDLE